MVAEIIGVSYELVDIMDVQKEKFQKLNPQLTIPFIVDDGFILSER